jgi:hypothetical protein
MSHTTRTLVLVALTSGLLGCTGTIGDVTGDAAPAGSSPSSSAAAGPGGSGPTSEPGTTGPTGGPAGPVTPVAPSAPTFSCDANAVPPSLPLRRLSDLQYTNAVRDAIAFALGGDAAAAPVMTALQGALVQLPVDDPAHVPEAPSGSYSRLAQDLAQAHADAYYAIAVAVGAQLGRRERLGTLLGTCATDAATDNDATCVDAFIRRFGERVYRRPLLDDDLAFYRRFYGGAVTGGIDPAGIGDIVAGLLSSPYFIYMVEHGETAQPGRKNVFSLAPQELASRLAFQFWDAPPDDALLNVARSGALRDPASYDRELARVLADPRAQKTLDEFYSDYFRLQDLPDVSTSNAFKAFAGTDLPMSMPALRQDMKKELLDFARQLTWTTPARFADLLTSEMAPPRGAALAALYGTPGSTTAAPRPGFLTRAAMLLSGVVRTRPIAKGAFIRKWVLCDSIPPPPDNAANTPLDTKNRSTREAVELLTEQPGTACAACHKTMINALGFATESFDALGRARTVERLFDDNGKEVGQRPVNTSVVPRVALDDMRTASGPADLVRLMAESGKPQACFARHYFRYTFARWESDTPDGCTLERLRKGAVGGEDLRGVVRTVAQAPAFKERSFD